MLEGENEGLIGGMNTIDSEEITKIKNKLYQEFTA